MASSADVVRELYSRLKPHALKPDYKATRQQLARDVLREHFAARALYVDVVNGNVRGEDGKRYALRADDAFRVDYILTKANARIRRPNR